MTYTEIHRQAALDPHLQARACHDVATAALRFDQARARMWGWRKEVQTQIRGIRLYDSCGMERVAWRWQTELGILCHHYSEARRQAIIWRKRVKELS